MLVVTSKAIFILFLETLNAATHQLQRPSSTLFKYVHLYACIYLTP